ncbi:prephenate dehydrogenase (NADP(+)) [Tilletia horrida]|nr:prephenate dehydrogenase (NADP(+)) [Tilletia horrida]
MSDRAENYDKLKAELAEKEPGLTVYKDGHRVARRSEIIIYSVETAFLDAVVAQDGPSTKIGAIVSAQTSVKAPKQTPFDAYPPTDVAIISCHSLHGPTVDTTGQPLVLPITSQPLASRLKAAFPFAPSCTGQHHTCKFGFAIAVAFN